MKKKTRNILIILVSILIIVAIGTNIEIGGGCEPQAPERLSNIPKSAVWSGGCDGGNWFDFKILNQDTIRFKVYLDHSGELLIDANFLITNCEDMTISESIFNQSSFFYSDEKITIEHSQDAFCVAIPIYPAFDGIDWEILKEKE